MTLTEYKKIIKGLSREELESHLFNLFKSNKVFKDIESSSWDPDTANEELLKEYYKRLEKAFWKESFSLSECKGVLKEYLSRTTDDQTKAEIQLGFAQEAAELSKTYGDFGDSFYNSLISAAEKFINYCKTDTIFFDNYEEGVEKLIDTCGYFGYGVSDDLEVMLDECREALGYGVE
jgi:hypothetical protein